MEETNSHGTQVFNLGESFAVVGRGPTGRLTGPSLLLRSGGTCHPKSRTMSRPQGHLIVPGFSPWPREAAAVEAIGLGSAEPAFLSGDMRTGRSAGCGKGAGSASAPRAGGDP